MNLLKSLAAVSSITMISRVLGFVRDTLLARIFGASMATDAFFIAFKLPNLLRRIFAEGAFSQAFVPILAEYKTQQGEEATRTFIAYVSGLLTLVLMLVTVAGMLAAPWVIWATAPGFANTPERFALTTDLLRVTFPYILLISLSSLAGAILNTWNRFSVPAFVPTLLNVSMIIFALFLTPYFDPPVMALGWAVLAGGLAQLLYQLPHLKKIGMLVLPRLNLKDTGVWRVMRNMLPAILGGVGQPDFADHQHGVRLIAGVRFGVVDVLRRSLDGAAVRRPRRGPGHDSAADAGAYLREQGPP